MQSEDLKSMKNVRSKSYVCFMKLYNNLYSLVSFNTRYAADNSGRGSGCGSPDVVLHLLFLPVEALVRGKEEEKEKVQEMGQEGSATSAYQTTFK
jgi:hypothetical protein